MHYKMLYVFCILVLVGVSQGDESCNFPARWSRNPYFTHRMVIPEGAKSLSNYRVSFWTESTSHEPNTDSATYHCKEFENGNTRATYLSVISGKLERLSGMCIEQNHYIPQSDSTGGYLITKKVYNEDVGNNKCEDMLAGISLYSVYLPVKMSRHDEEYTMAFANNMECPLLNSPFRVTYAVSDSDQNHCENERSSVLSVSRAQISILACDIQKYKGFPLTGILKCLGHMSAQEIGEPNDDNGAILIIQWLSATQKYPHYYCSRYKQYPDKTIILSMDMTATDSINCQRGARYDWYGQHGDRSYFRMNLTYDPALASSTSSTMSPVTTPLNTSTPTPIPSSTTSPSGVATIQMTLDMPYPYPDDINIKKKELRALLWSKCNIVQTRIAVLLGGEDKETVVIYKVEPDKPTALECVQHLNQLGSITFSDKTVNIKGDVIYQPAESACPEMRCQNEGACWKKSDDYTCLCADGIEGQYCQVSASTGGNRSQFTVIVSLSVVAGVLVIIAIVVAVVVTKRCRKDKVALENASDYDSMGTMDKQERDMINSMSRATAYHDKAFIGDAEEGDHGEKTGIHGFSNSGYM